jgi:hypothetical protein
MLPTGKTDISVHTKDDTQEKLTIEKKTSFIPNVIWRSSQQDTYSKRQGRKESLGYKNKAGKNEPALSLGTLVQD